MGLGNKLNRAFSSLGNKTNKITNSIGNKTSNILKEVKGVVNVLEKKAGQFENTANNAYADASKIVNKIPEYNEKLIGAGNTIIKKSGGITDALRKSTMVGDKIIQGAIALGGKDIPIVGSALSLAGKASSQLARGTNKLDDARDKAQNKLDKYAEVSRGTIGDIEKMNRRKKEEMARANETGDLNFV